jgi:uncharacterized protein
MIWAVPAGLLAGLALGYLGAGGTVVGLPFVLYLAGLSPHLALGTNALGVSLTALALLLWRLSRRQVPVRHGVIFTLPGVVGIYVGVQAGLVYPGRKLIYLLGLLLFVVAAWIYYLSTLPGMGLVAAGVAEPRGRRRLSLMAPVAFVIGTAAGFFAIGGGFMIVPGLSLAGGLELTEAAAASLLPIAAFSGWIGAEYWKAGSVNLSIAGMMLAAGLVGGMIGIWLGQRLSKRATQRVFAVFLCLLGLYMTLG